jgi:hypothetical protein
LTREDAIGHARIVASSQWNENDIMRVAGALLQVDRCARETAFARAAEEVEALVRRLCGMATAAREEGR